MTARVPFGDEDHARQSSSGVHTLARRLARTSSNDPAQD
ncbi:hypothetical protein I552_8680 [Mycobacterium xenopi 3993]|nr:hypothetical protein I552_8680 [Mycobacterium xenopi 3993]